MGYEKSAEAIVLGCCNILGRAELIKQEAVTRYSLDMERRIKNRSTL
jgi:hypothetical protein